MSLRLHGFADFANYQLPEIGLILIARISIGDTGDDSAVIPGEGVLLARRGPPGLQRVDDRDRLLGVRDCLDAREIDAVGGHQFELLQLMP